MRPHRTRATSGAARGKCNNQLLALSFWLEAKSKASAFRRGFFSSGEIAVYFTFKKMIASVYSASDSISTRPRISAN